MTDKMSGGKKFGLSLVIIIPLIIAILILSLIAMVGVGSFVKNELSSGGGYQLQKNIGNILPATDTAIIKTDDNPPATSTNN